LVRKPHRLTKSVSGKIGTAAKIAFQPYELVNQTATLLLKPIALAAVKPSNVIQDARTELNPSSMIFFQWVGWMQ